MGSLAVKSAGMAAFGGNTVKRVFILATILFLVCATSAHAADSSNSEPSKKKSKQVESKKTQKTGQDDDTTSTSDSDQSEKSKKSDVTFQPPTHAPHTTANSLLGYPSMFHKGEIVVGAEYANALSAGGTASGMIGLHAGYFIKDDLEVELGYYRYLTTITELTQIELGGIYHISLGHLKNFEYGACGGVLFARPLSSAYSYNGVGLLVGVEMKFTPHLSSSVALTESYLLGSSAGYSVGNGLGFDIRANFSF